MKFRIGPAAVAMLAYFAFRRGVLPPLTRRSRHRLPWTRMGPWSR